MYLKIHLINVLASAVVLLPVYVISGLVLFRDRSWRWRAGYLLLGLYFAALFSVVGLPQIDCLVFEPSVHLVPLADVLAGSASYRMSAALNVLLFVPAGVLLPMLWGGFDRAWRTVLFGFCLSFGVEWLQLFTFRLTDVDDLICNTLGSAIGWLIACAALRGERPRQGKRDILALPILLGAALLAHFFVQPFVAAVIWQAI